jgi:hypothetical protein
LKSLYSTVIKLKITNSYVRIGLLFISFIFLSSHGYAQSGSCATPIVVDLSGSADTTTTVSGSRNGNCCAGTNCISFTILVNPNTDLINFNTDQITGASFYSVNCGPLVPNGTPACITGQSTIQITFCKPGNNIVTATITASRAVKASGDLSLRQGCTGTLSVTGLQTSSVVWTSIYPGVAGTYDSYLSQTSGATTITVTPQSGSPAYIDYKVSGNENTACASAKTDTVRVYTFPPLTVTATSPTTVICSGSPVVLTATASGGDPAYTYLWSTGATTPTISVTTAGTYTVSVNDQSTSCGPVTAQVIMTAYTAVPPTAPPVSVCYGNTATLTATAPGGPYQWFDASGNPLCACTSASVTTPVLTSSTTYYVSTSFNGCPSTKTAIPVTVTPLPSKPNIGP